MSAPAFDAVQAREYLEMLFPQPLVDGERIEVRLIKPDVHGADCTFAVGIEEALSTIATGVMWHRNVYVGVATRRSDRSGKKDNLRAVRALWLDRDGLLDAGAREAHEVAIERFLRPPSFRVWSGGGEHDYWLLEEPLDLSDAEMVRRLEYVLKGIASMLDGDRATTDASRVLRVPGTLNLPDAKKRAAGRVPASASIIQDAGHLYTFDDFAELEERGRALAGNSADRITYSAQGWDGTEPEWLEALLANDAEIRRRFERDASGLNDRTSSGVDMSLASLAAIRAGLAGEELEVLLRCSRGRAQLPAEGPSHYRSTVGKALAAAAEQRRRKAVDADDEEAAFQTTDKANALRLARHFGGELRYCKGLNWLVWTGSRWEVSETRALKVASRLGRIVRREAAEAAEKAAAAESEAEREKLDDAVDALMRWARDSEQERRVSAALKMARPFLEIALEALDADPYLLGCENGVVDLRTGTLRPHAHEDYITKSTGVVYDATARLHLWDAVLERALPDPELRRFTQKAAGYTAIGAKGEDVLLTIYGPTRTAKGTVEGSIAAALGEYAETAGLEDLAHRGRGNGAQPRPELARLRGARMASIYETGRELRLNAALVKSMAGSDPITVRALYEAPFTFRPTFAIWIASNHRPQVDEDDDALWERIRELPFRVQIPPEERDPEVRRRLCDPADGGPAVLRWIVDGALAYQGEGLRPPAPVVEATADYREEMDPLRDFLEECCRLAPDAWALSADLRRVYESWCRENGKTPLGSKDWPAALRRHRFEPLARDAGRGWRGVGLLTTRSPSA